MTITYHAPDGRMYRRAETSGDAPSAMDYAESVAKERPGHILIVRDEDDNPISAATYPEEAV